MRDLGGSVGCVATLDRGWWKTFDVGERTALTYGRVRDESSVSLICTDLHCWPTCTCVLQGSERVVQSLDLEFEVVNPGVYSISSAPDPQSTQAVAHLCRCWTAQLQQTTRQ